jgi:hypothetical protein
MNPQEKKLVAQSVSTKIKEDVETKEESVHTYISDLYDVTKLTGEDVKNLWEAFSYKGFNREETLKQLSSAVKDKNIALQLIVAVALRGPQAASQLKLSNNQTPIQMGIPASGGKGSKALTLNKILSATSDLAAYVLKQMNVPKRLNSPLPGWLQFPSAGSIILPENLRSLHMDFSKTFSTVIGGTFNEQIYMQMQINAYLDPKLHLFDV